MSIYSGQSGSHGGSSYHVIKGYSGAGLPGNPLTDASKTDDPYVSEQQKLQAIMRNPTLHVESDGSMVYDPNYLPKHKKIISMAPYDTKGEYDPVEPLFWLTCACVVGLSVFIVFIIVSAMRLPFDVMYGSPVYAGAGTCAGFLFISIFLFYAFSSKDERCFGRFLDGFFGGLPFIFLGALLGYMYSGLILLMVELVNYSPASEKMLWWFTVFSTVPPFLLLFIPMFIVAMQVQEASSISARILKGIPSQPMGYIPRSNYIGHYLFSAIRRFTVGFAMGIGIAAYYTITFYALGMLGYGFYRSTKEYYWIPIVVLIPVALMLIVFFGLMIHFKPYTLQCLFAPWTEPLVAWSPIALRSAYFPRYHTGMTVKQMIRQTNNTIRKAGRCHVRGDYTHAEELYNEADAQRLEIEQRGIALRERDHRSWRKLNTQKQSGVKRRHMQKN